MGAPIGNQNAVGNRGGGRGGRYSAGYEWMQEKLMQELLSNKINFAELEASVQSGECYFGEYLLYRAVVQGKDLVLVKLIDKLFSDKPSIKSIQNEPLTDEEKAELSDQLDRAFDQFNEIGYKPKLRLDAHQSPIGTKGSGNRKPRKAA